MSTWMLLADAAVAQVAQAKPPVDAAILAQQYANDLLTWVGFGTLVGLAAKAIMPGKDPGGAIATLAMGIGGTIIGCGCLMYFRSGTRVSPISPVGFAAGTAGAFLLLFFYRLLGGRFFHEGDGGLRLAAPAPRPRGRRRRYVDAPGYYD